MAEGLMASVVLAVAVAGIAGPLGAAAEQSRLSRESSTALVLARALLEEIAGRPLWDGGTSCHLGPETSSGETSRAVYDSADDYHLYSDTTGGLTTTAGSAAGSFAGTYRRSVTVEYRAAPGGAAAASGDFALVTVKVVGPNERVVQVSKLLTRYGTAP